MKVCGICVFVYYYKEADHTFKIKPNSQKINKKKRKGKLKESNRKLFLASFQLVNIIYNISLILIFFILSRNFL